MLLNMNRLTGNIIIKIMVIYIAHYYHLEIWQVDQSIIIDIVIIIITTTIITIAIISVISITIITWNSRNFGKLTETLNIKRKAQKAEKLGLICNSKGIDQTIFTCDIKLCY